MSIIANKWPHVYAALCTTPEAAAGGRSVNGANVLCLGGQVTAADDACRWGSAAPTLPLLCGGGIGVQPLCFQPLEPAFTQTMLHATHALNTTTTRTLPLSLLLLPQDFGCLAVHGAGGGVGARDPGIHQLQHAGGACAPAPAGSMCCCPALPIALRELHTLGNAGHARQHASGLPVAMESSISFSVCLIGTCPSFVALFSVLVQEIPALAFTPAAAAAATAAPLRGAVQQPAAGQ